MATVGRDIESVELSERELWVEGPRHEVFKEMRSPLSDPLDGELRGVPRGGGLLVGDDRRHTRRQS